MMVARVKGVGTAGEHLAELHRLVRLVGVHRPGGEIVHAQQQGRAEHGQKQGPVEPALTFQRVHGPETGVKPGIRAGLTGPEGRFPLTQIRPLLAGGCTAGSGYGWPKTSTMPGSARTSSPDSA